MSSTRDRVFEPVTLIEKDDNAEPWHILPQRERISVKTWRYSSRSKSERRYIHAEITLCTEEIAPYRVSGGPEMTSTICSVSSMETNAPPCRALSCWAFTSMCHYVFTFAEETMRYFCVTAPNVYGFTKKQRHISRASGLICLGQHIHFKCTLYLCDTWTPPFLHNVLQLRKTVQLESLFGNESYKSNVLCLWGNLMPRTIWGTGKCQSCAI